MKIIRLTCCLLLLSASSFAATVRGKITDAKGELLPFVSVYQFGTTRGTTSNAEGRYSLNLPAGEARLIFRLIGYKLLSVDLRIAGDTVVDAMLETEAYNLQEVQVKADAEDPAYAIMRKAIAKRKFYLSQVKEFTCDAYTKFLQKMDEHPKKILGKDVDMSEVLDTVSNILYLSESVSKLSYRYPEDVREEMISSKVSGSNKAFSFNQAAGLLFNFYENLIPLGGISMRGIVSPVASNALFYYRYRYEGEVVENGVTVNKITVIPRRKHDPVFQGVIYIQDSSWRIHSLDLFVTKESQLQIVDTLTFHQVYVPVAQDTWMPFSAQVDFVFGFLGFHGSGYFLGISSNYNITPEFPKGYFSGEILKVHRDANQKDSVYWQQARQVPLTLEESRDYVRKDSATALHESKPYRDSIDRKNNKFKPFDFFLSGYTYNRSFRKESFSVSGLLSSVQYNTVEGLCLDMGLAYRKGDEEEGKNYRLEGHVRYGFSNGHLNIFAAYRRRYDPLHLGRYGISAGTSVMQFNNAKPISEFINTAYTLFSEHNYMKIYERRFVSVFHESEIANGVMLRLEPTWEKRLPLVNTSDYSFSDKDNRVFTSNDPQNPGTDDGHFREHEAFLARAVVTLTPGQEYIMRPDGKIPLGTNWPTFEFTYTGAFEWLGGDIACHRLDGTVTKAFDLGLLGSTQVWVGCGDIVGQKHLEFMDWIHFQGNSTIFSGFEPGSYQLLGYYPFSTTDFYYTGQLEHNFGGLVLNKIPFLRKLKLAEIAGVHYLHTPQLGSYTEVSFGLEKLGIFRLDFVMSFNEQTKPASGFIFGIKGF